MKNLKLVILDYPRKNLFKDEAKIIFSDTILNKQINFIRASEKYISMNALDMLSTHYLIYDVKNFLRPKLILAIRTVFEPRARHHNLNLPIEDYIDCAPKEYKDKFLKFRTDVGSLVDCSAWFVDPAYGYTQTKLPLSEIAYFSIVTFILRAGYHNWVGATNERFKASRWAMKTGRCEDGLIFTHPKVPDPHKLLLIKDFDYKWLHDCIEKYGDFLRERFEILPDDESFKTLEDVFQEIESTYSGRLKIA